MTDSKWIHGMETIPDQREPHIGLHKALLNLVYRNVLSLKTFVLLWVIPSKILSFQIRKVPKRTSKNTVLYFFNIFYIAYVKL